MIATDSLSPSQIPYPHLEGKPHWHRTLAVYMVLDDAEGELTYSEALDWVETKTGQRCSRKLISKWKAEKHLRVQVSTTSDPTPRPVSVTHTITSFPRQPAIIRDSEQVPRQKPKPQTSTQKNWLNKMITVSSIALAVVGLTWIVEPEPKAKKLANAEAPVTVTNSIPSRSQPSTTPRQLKVTVFVTQLSDLKIQPDEQVIQGQIISDRPSERATLLAKKQQLEIAIQKVSIPVALPVQPNFDIPVLALEKAQTSLSVSNSVQPVPLPTLNFIDPQLQQVFESDKLREINRIKLDQIKQQQEYRQQTIDLQIARARIEETKAQYQSDLTQYQQSVERQQYELSSLRSQLEATQRDLEGLGQVRSPYTGTVRKIKVKGQKEALIEVEVTIVPEKSP